MTENILRIDGSYGEGGGSIVRFAISFAALIKRPVTIFNIRSKRKNPGLRTQHLTGIKLVHQVFGGDLKGAEVGSTVVNYSPPTDFVYDSNFFTISIPVGTFVSLLV